MYKGAYNILQLLEKVVNDQYELKNNVFSILEILHVIDLGRHSLGQNVSIWSRIKSFTLNLLPVNYQYNLKYWLLEFYKNSIRFSNSWFLQLFFTTFLKILQPFWKFYNVIITSRIDLAALLRCPYRIVQNTAEFRPFFWNIRVQYRNILPRSQNTLPEKEIPVSRTLIKYNVTVTGENQAKCILCLLPW